MNNFKLRTLAVSFVFGTACMTSFLVGCNRQDTTPANGVKPATTTIGMEIDDTVLTTKVKSALLGDQTIKGFDIKVGTRKGVVLLSGFVENQAQIDRAIAITRSVEGAKDVENSMVLKEGKASVGNKVDDSIVTAKVKSALLSDPIIKSFEIVHSYSLNKVIINVGREMANKWKR